MIIVNKYTGTTNQIQVGNVTVNKAAIVFITCPENKTLTVKTIFGETMLLAASFDTLSSDGESAFDSFDDMIAFIDGL